MKWNNVPSLVVLRLLLTIFSFQAETTVINQCNQLLSPSAEPNYVMTYLTHSFPQHRQYLCAGAWMLMNGHLEINSANLVWLFFYHFDTTVYVTLYVLIDLNAGSCLERVFTWRSYGKHLYNGWCSSASYPTWAPTRASSAGDSRYLFFVFVTEVVSLVIYLCGFPFLVAIV